MWKFQNPEIKANAFYLYVFSCYLIIGNWFYYHKYNISPSKMQPLPSGCGVGGVIPIFIYTKNKAAPWDSLYCELEVVRDYLETRRSLIRAFLPVRLRK